MRSEELMRQTRHRYIAFEVRKVCPVDDTKASLIRAILGKLRERSPAEGYFGAKFNVIEYDAARSKGIIKIVPHIAVEKMKSLILSVDDISGCHVETRVLGTSGTLKATRRKYMKYQER
jgi:RNase P/RNase MRP subunit POP5